MQLLVGVLIFIYQSYGSLINVLAFQGKQIFHCQCLSSACHSCFIYVAFMLTGVQIFNSLHAWKFFMLFCHQLIFLKKISFPGIPLECQTVWIQIRTDIMSVLIWIQIVCKAYQQLAHASKQLTFFLVL